MTSGLEGDNPLKPRSQAASRGLCELHEPLLMLLQKQIQRPGAKKSLPRARYGVQAASQHLPQTTGLQECHAALPCHLHHLPF